MIQLKSVMPQTACTVVFKARGKKIFSISLLKKGGRFSFMQCVISEVRNTVATTPQKSPHKGSEIAFFPHEYWENFFN